MTDTTVNADPRRKVGVSFSRKINIEALGGPKYESAELFMYVEDYVDLDAEPADVAATLRTLASTVKATCLDESGLDWEASDDGVVIERLRNAFPGASVTAINAASTPVESSSQPTQAQALAGASEPPYAGQKLDFKADKDKLAEQREWAVARWIALGNNPFSEFYDNRESKPRSNSPDFRHKTEGISLWADNVTKAGGSIPAA